jgi:carbonic anhydrase
MKFNKVLTAEEQSKLTPDSAIDFLRQGNQTYSNNSLTVEVLHDAAGGQYPAAVSLSCMDSRVPVKEIFHCGIGDIFVTRVAGNIVNPDILGSMEYACKVSGAKLIVVMGHDNCGAVKSAIEDIEFGNITGLINKIKPAVYQSRASYKGEASSSNKEFVDLVCHTNVELMVNDIRTNSPALKEMEEKGEIKIVGAMYDMESGEVEFFDNM